MKKYALDSTCYLEASRSAGALEALSHFVAWAAPGLYVSSVVAAELRAGARTAKDRQQLNTRVLAPLVSRGRVLVPSGHAWDALAQTLATVRETEGLQLSTVSRGFAFDVLLAYSCREQGITLVSANTRDMARIRRVFKFEYVAPYPTDG